MPIWVALEDWIEIKVSGPETIEYLNGIITKDLEKIEEGYYVRAAFLTPQAKVRSVFWLRLFEGTVYFYCPGHMKQSLVEDLLKYKLSMDVKLEDITEETPKLYLISDQVITTPGLSNDNISFSIIHTDEPKGGEVISYSEFLSLLVKEGIAPTEIMTGENPYELGIDDVISLEKGCFLGQEPISRMYHRGNPRKYIYHVEIPETEESTISNAQGDEIGEVLIRNDNLGLAFIRRTETDLDHLTIKNQPVKVLSRVGTYPSNDRT